MGVESLMNFSRRTKESLKCFKKSTKIKSSAAQHNLKHHTNFFFKKVKKHSFSLTVSFFRERGTEN